MELLNFYQYKMTQYNSLNVKLQNSQLNKLNSAIKNETYQKIWKEKPNKIWVDKGREFFNEIMVKKKLIQRCIQHIMKLNLFLLKDLPEL